MDIIDINQIEYLNSQLTVLKGIGAKKAELFAKLHIFNVWDLLYYFPRQYEDRRNTLAIRDCVIGESCCIRVKPEKNVIEKRIKSKMSLFILQVSDASGTVAVKWFSAPFCKPKIEIGTEYCIYGKPVLNGKKNEFELKCIEKTGEQKFTEKIVPLYHATAGLTSKLISETIQNVFEHGFVLQESMPESILHQYNLLDINRAVSALHHPTEIEYIASARNRLAFEELFLLQLALFHLKKRRDDKNGLLISDVKCVRNFSAILSFELTNGQKTALNEICADLKSGKPMNRLLQGDVGSGKTVVGAAACYAVCKAGYQAAFMAPTEILAQQHYQTLSNLFGDKLKIGLLTSSVKSKKQVIESIALGQYDIIVGTHALLEDKVKFANLALCITDEQHRFGVHQRAKLSAKGKSPHVLVMSATPIPRTLSLILYGDLDISVIKTMPKNRKPILTYCISSELRDRAYAFVRKSLDAGRQCYMVCPLVEDSDAMDALSVDKLQKQLTESIFPSYRVSFIHGKMKDAEKDTVMRDFQQHKIDILVSTTVIEVGVDVSNAAVMMIENAERFGLSQLHQLRGRVGRGEHQSYCILVTDNDNEETLERMKIMTQTGDGFVISQKDLELRGSGEFFGIRQHGLPELKVANLFTDLEILKQAQQAADSLLESDPLLQASEHTAIKERIDKLFTKFDDKDIFN